MLSFEDIMPSQVGGGKFKKPFRPHNEYGDSPVSFKRNDNVVSINPNIKSTVNDKPIETKTFEHKPQKDIITPINKFPQETKLEKEIESSLERPKEETIEKPKEEIIEEPKQDIRNEYHTKEFKKHFKGKPIDKSKGTEITREELFKPFSHIDRINAPMIEQPTQIGSRVYPVQEIMYEIPRVENRYIVMNDNPYQDVSRLNFLYEDFIPEPLMPNRISTISDRLSLGEFIADNILSLFEKDVDKVYSGRAAKTILESLHKDDIDGFSKLFSKMKTTKLNPNLINPTEKVPENFMIYSSCYPIKSTSSSVQCSKASQKINLRIYKTPFSSKEIIKKDDEKDGNKYYEIVENTDNHISKEFEFYQKLNNIVSSHQSPNFPLCYGIVKNIYDTSVKFTPNIQKLETSNPKNYDDAQMEKLTNQIKRIFIFLKKRVLEKISLTVTDKDKIEKKVKNLTDEIDYIKSKYDSIDKMDYSDNYKNGLKKRLIMKMQEYLNSVVKYFNMNKYEDFKLETEEEAKKAGEELIRVVDDNGITNKIKRKELENVLSFSLCESPEWSYDEWTNAQTVRQHGVSKMLSSGWHTPEEWKVFMFQLIYAFIVMKEHDIYIPDFSTKNIFIKNIPSTSILNKLFIYEIDGIKYYVPNFGFYVMIDERFAGDVPNNKKLTEDQKKEISVSIDEDLADKQKETMYNKMKQIIDDINKKCGIITGDNPNDLMQNKKSLRDILIHSFTSFGNNRCGSIVSANEYKTIDNAIKQLIDYECGEIVLKSIENDTRFQIVQILNNDVDNNKITYQTTERPNEKEFVIKTDSINNFYSVKNNSIFFQFKDKYDRIDDNVIETYSITTTDKNKIKTKNENVNNASATSTSH